MAEPVQRRISQVIDVGTSGGDWMFKQEDMVFGPMPARVLIEKMYQGEIGPETLVAPSDGEFSPLHSVAFFTVHLAKAQARLRVKRDTDEFNTSERRVQTRRTTVFVVLVVGALIAAGGGAYFFVVQKQGRLQREIDEIPITMNAPELDGARQGGAGDEVEISVPGSPGATKRIHRPGVAANEAGGSHPTTDGLADINYDKNSIIGAEVRQKGTLIPCIKQELARAPEFRGDIKFSVAIGNDGRVAKLWMEDAQFKDGPLQNCFMQKMNGWKFTTYEGERATLSDSFKVGR